MNLLTRPLCATAITRATVSLDGTWQHVVTTAPDERPPATGWSEVAVPGTVFLGPQGGSHYLWYRRDIEIPAAWKGMRIFVDVRGARYDPHVYLDGKRVGYQLNGWAPLEVEITAQVQDGQKHRLELRCQDRGAVFADGFQLPAGGSDDLLRGKTLAPVGGYKDAVGPWQSVLLESTPQDRIPARDLAIIPSTRDRTLTLTGTVDSSRSRVWVEARVLDGAREALHIAPVGVQQSGTHLWKLEAAFPKAHFWSPEDPHLYSLELILRDGPNGAKLDTLTTRFGFKEIWTQGHDFYLNGIKRHLLASATWPLLQYESYDVIRKKASIIRAGGAIAFRCHIGPWQEEWMRAADEVGLLIVDEAAVYTDGNGMYAYTDPRFWENYRQFLDGMIRRDRNHACVAMWSLGNEILFMGNQKYDKDLPHKQGELARYVKTLDPYHPTTFEADLDPDGAFDVIGLHYPHELPWYFDYPNTCDWLGSRVTTDAAGGMLGKRSSDFFWDRKKPLYIGEFLWVPQQDYSVGSVFFGDRAYLDRQLYHDRAQALAFYDQVLAFRRSGVSGIGPWTVYGFGGVVENRALYALQQEYYRPVAAYLRNRGLRYFGGEKTSLTFDVFNDGDRAHHLTLRLEAIGGKVIATQSLVLEPGGYQSISLPFTAPTTGKDARVNLDSVLLADGQETHRVHHALRIFPRHPLQTPKNTTLVCYDPERRWPGALTSLEALDRGNASTKVLLVAPYAFNAAVAPQKGMAIIGGRRFDTARFLAFLKRGGRALVMEQETLAPIGLDLTLADYRSTMTFPLREGHPLLKGLEPDDLKFWRGDNYVALKQIRRPDAHGAQAVVVSGGPDALDMAPVIEMNVGAGHLVLMQTLAGTRREIDPAAARLLQNAVDTLAKTGAATDGHAMLLSEDSAFGKRVEALGLAMEQTDQPLTSNEAQNANGWILDGGGASIRDSGPAIAAYLNHGGTVYWHSPDPVTFEAIRHDLGADGIHVEVKEAATSLALREDPLLTGISREDMTCTTKPQGWDRQMKMQAHGAGVSFLPVEHYPPGTKVLATPEALLTWKQGAGRVVLDGLHWDADGDNALKGRRYASAFFANLGLSFTPPIGGPGFEPIPLKDFRLVGESPYFEGTADQLTLRSNGRVEASFYCARSGDYDVRVEANSTPYQKVYALAQVKVDGTLVGDVEVTSETTQAFLVGRVHLEKGVHVFSLAFTNDASGNGEDRNLFVKGIALQPHG